MPEEFNTGDPKIDEALKRLDGRFKDLEDAMLVQSFLDKKAGERLKEHAKFIATHEIAIAEITDKLNLLIDREMKREGGPEIR